MLTLPRTNNYQTVSTGWVGSRSPDGWDQIPSGYRPGGWVLHQPPWSFGFDSQTRGTRENRRPQPPAGSQDNSTGKLLLPQLNRLHEAFKRRQVSPSASFSRKSCRATSLSRLNTCLPWTPPHLKCLLVMKKGGLEVALLLMPKP